MSLLPISETDVAELMPTKASHMVAAFCLFDEHAARRASFPFLEVVLEVGVAWSFVVLQHAFPAK